MIRFSLIVLAFFMLTPLFIYDVFAQTGAGESPFERRLENWKINPSLSFLNEEIWLSFNFVVSTPSMVTFPFVGPSKSPIMFSNVDFPEPELPTTSRNSPLLTLNETSRKALTSVSPSP